MPLPSRPPESPFVPAGLSHRPLVDSFLATVPPVPPPLRRENMTERRQIRLTGLSFTGRGIASQNGSERRGRPAENEDSGGTKCRRSELGDGDDAGVLAPCSACSPNSLISLFVFSLSLGHTHTRAHAQPLSLFPSLSVNSPSPFTPKYAYRGMRIGTRKTIRVFPRERSSIFRSTVLRRLAIPFVFARPVRPRSAGIRHGILEQHALVRARTLTRSRSLMSVGRITRS